MFELDQCRPAPAVVAFPATDEGEELVPHYRCYCVDGSNHIRAVNVIDCENDATARARGVALLAACRHAAAEIWDGARRVSRIDRAELDRGATGAGECCCAAGHGGHDHPSLERHGCAADTAA